LSLHPRRPDPIWPTDFGTPFLLCFICIKVTVRFFTPEGAPFFRGIFCLFLFAVTLSFSFWPLFYCSCPALLLPAAAVPSPFPPVLPFLPFSGQPSPRLRSVSLRGLRVGASCEPYPSLLCPSFFFFGTPFFFTPFSPLVLRFLVGHLVRAFPLFTGPASTIGLSQGRFTPVLLTSPVADLTDLVLFSLFFGPSYCSATRPF